jgi:hypothetical protein
MLTPTQRKSSMQSHESFKLAVERYSAGEFDKEEAGRIEAHLLTCMECKEYLLELQLDKKQFLNLHPYSEFAQALSPATRQTWYKPFFETLRRPALFPAYGCIALLLILGPVLYFRNSNSPTMQGITLKGGNGISFLVKRNGQVSSCTPRDTVFAGDELQVLYSTQTAGFVSCLSIDSRGAISWYHPDLRGTICSAPTKSGMNLPYPASIALDNSQGQELIILLLTKHALETETVKKWVTKAVQNSNTNLSNIQRELQSNKSIIGAELYSGLFVKGSR